MKDHLYPGRSDRDGQVDALKKFLKAQRKRIDIEEQRLAALSDVARNAASSDARQLIHNIHRLP